MRGYKAAESNNEDQMRNDRSLMAQCQAVADMKFTYVVSCQQYGIQKRNERNKAQDILRLMIKYFPKIVLICLYSSLVQCGNYLILFGRYPSLRVAYIDEVEVTSIEKSKRPVDKVYYSALVKAVPKSVDSSEPDQKLDQVLP